MLTGYWWANYAGKRLVRAQGIVAEGRVEMKAAGQSGAGVDGAPSVLRAFLPVGVPIFLIAARSFLLMDKAADTGWLHALAFLGDPVIALSAGVLLAFYAGRSWNRETISRLLQEAVEKAGGILVIIGAGGGFGAVLAATHPGQHFGQLLAAGSRDYYSPFS